MKIKSQVLFIIVLFFSYSVIACSDDSIDDGFAISYYAESSIKHQSAAVCNDYLFFLPAGRSTVHLYNMKLMQMLCSSNLGKGKNTRIFHCNQASFGVDYYTPDDDFPLLYVSQFLNEDSRCFTEVFRIIPSRDDSSFDISSFDAKLVQTIYYPVMSEVNSLGNVNTVIDQENRLMYTYSRNNNQQDSNYMTCKISCFNIPDVHQEEVYLEDEDIMDSYMLPCRASNMQGGCIKNGKLYIGQGYLSVGYIFLNVVDLAHRQLEKQVNLLQHGFRKEPEGCFWYDGSLMISTAGGNIWRIEEIISNMKQ